MQYEETYFIKVKEINVLRNIAKLHHNSFVDQFGSVGHIFLDQNNNITISYIHNHTE